MMTEEESFDLGLTHTHAHTHTHTHTHTRTHSMGTLSTLAKPGELGLFTSG